MKKIYSVGTLVLLVGIGIFWWMSFANKIQTEPESNDAKPKLNITASFYQLAELAQNIGGNLVNVTNITPAGAEPHEYEPTGQDIAQVYNSSILLINGNGLDPWGEKIENDLANRGITVVNMSNYLDSIVDTSEDDHGGYDPHFWLDPKLTQKQANIIAEVFAKIDPNNAQEYFKNRDFYKGELENLDKEYSVALSDCKQNTIVTAHNAFNYLAARYNLNTLYIKGLSTEEEPSPKTIAKVTNQAKAKGIKYIFFETLVDPKLSETIAKEIGAETLVLNPIEGLTQEELTQGKNYISLMKENLNNLKIALACQ